MGQPMVPSTGSPQIKIHQSDRSRFLLDLEVLDAIILPLQFVIRNFYEELPLFFIISKIEVGSLGKQLEVTPSVANSLRPRTSWV